MSSSETPFRVQVPTDVETFIVGRSYELLRREVGPFSGKLAPGIYKFNFRRGTASSDQLVEIPPDRIEPVVVVPAQELELDTAVPLAKSKRSGARQVSAAREMSKQTQIHAGHGSSVYVFIRNDAGTAPRDPAMGFTLHALDGALIADIGQVAVRDDVNNPTCAAFNIAVTPGAYRLRYDDGDEPLEQIVIATGGWQTQVFLLHRAMPTEGPPAASAHPLANASVLMCHSEFDPDNELIELADSARIALSLGRVRMPRDLMEKLLTDKFESPMLGIYAAHAIAASSGRDSLLERVLSALEMTIGNHPDVAALQLAHKDGVTIDTPPMLRSSWNAIVAATLDGKASLAPGSLASQLPTSFASDTPWLIWSVRDLVPVEATAPRDVSADLDEIQLQIGTPAPAELTGWEGALYSYLQRRASYRSEEQTVFRGQMRGDLESLGASEAVEPAAAKSNATLLDERAIARAFGTTVNHVQATVAGLASKLKTK